jgi:hypothetical protein
MNLKQLFENAALDSFGLLDRREVELFEQALAKAAPSVRASIASLQDRLLRIDLPEGLIDGQGAEQPPSDLRDRVLSTVGAEIAAAAVSFTTADPAASMMIRAKGVSPWWRATAVGSIAAALVLGITTVMLRSAFNDVDAAVKASDMMRLVASYGDSFETALLDPATRFVQFDRSAKADAPAVAGVRPPAAILLMSGKGEGHLVARDLSSGVSKFVLVAIDESGQSSTIATISGPRVALKIPAAAMTSSTRLAIVPAGLDAGDAILRSGGTAISGLDLAERFAMLLPVMNTDSHH